MTKFTQIPQSSEELRIYFKKDTRRNGIMTSLAPNRLERLARYVVMWPWSTFYKALGPSRITSKEEEEFKILDTIDNFSELLNEGARAKFAEKRLTMMRERLIFQRERYLDNLTQWIDEKRQEFTKTIVSGYQYIIQFLDIRKKPVFLRINMPDNLLVLNVN